MTWFAERIPWRSGPWSLELRNDELADIAFEGRPVLRSAQAVIRDHNWNTVPLVVDRVGDSGATLTLHVRSEGMGSSFRGVVRIEARRTRLVVTADLESEHEFATNRTGLVALHSSLLAGEALTVTRTDGTVEESSFPTEISPHQPAQDLTQLSWRHAGSELSITFEGDVFEMEDQRNWSDASFKTYSRPLSLPFPYTVAAGERVRQRMLIDVRGVATENPRTASDSVSLTLGGSVPAIGLGAATAPDPRPVARGLSPASVLVDLDLRTSNWRAALSRAATSGAPLDVRIIAFDTAPWDEVATALSNVAVSPGVVRIGVFDADQHVSDSGLLDALRVAVRRAGVHASVIAGSRAHFAELNREWHRIPRDVDGVAVAITPLFHSLSTEQLVESIAVQRTIALDAAQLAGGLPVHVGPITLRPRFNNVATAPPPLPTHADLVHGYGAELFDQGDSRQSASELAAWTIASAAALANGGVASVTYFEEWGSRGVCDPRGEPYPVSSALAALMALRAPGARILSGGSADGLVWAIGTRVFDRDTVLVSNLDRNPRTVTVTSDRAATVASLEPSSFRRIDLSPTTGPRRPPPEED